MRAVKIREKTGRKDRRRCNEGFRVIKPCDARFWALPKRINKIAEIIVDREIIQRTLGIIPWYSFPASNSEGANYFFFYVRFLFCLIFLLLSSVDKKICIGYIFLLLTCHFLGLVRKISGITDPDNSPDIIFRLVLSVLHFSFNIKLCNYHHFFSCLLILMCSEE